MATRSKKELVDAFRVVDDQGGIHTVEVWATVTYTDDQGPTTRDAGVYAFYLRDGTRLIRNSDHTFTNTVTGQTLRWTP